LAAVAVLAVGAVSWNRLRPAAAWSAEGMRPLTTEPGIEADPALSADGRFLVYAANSGSGPRDLFLRSVSEGEPLRLTAGPADESAAAWSPAGDRIAFVRQTGGEPCRIVLLPVPRGAERTVGRCVLEPSTRLSRLDERTILLSDRSSLNEVSRIRALDVETGAVRDVSRPGLDSLGDSEPLPSPDGRSVVFRRNISHGIDHLYLADPRTGAERRLTRDGWKALGYAWAPDGRTLFYVTNRGGDFGLWSLDVRRASAPKRVSLGLRSGLSFDSLSADRAGKLAVETSSRRSNLFAFDGAAPPTPLTASAGRAWDPDVAPHGGLVYVSDQSGWPEVWVKPEGGEPAPVTQLAASYAHVPRWSPDGRRIAFIAARDSQTDLYTINADGSGLSRLTRDGAAKRSPVWDADGRSLVYVEQRGPAFRLMRVAAAGGEPVPAPGGAGFRALRPGWDGAFYGLKAGDPRLWRLPHAGGVATLASPTFRIDDSRWATGPQGVYQMRGVGTAAPSLWLLPWSGAERKLADLPPVAANPSMAVDPRTGALVLPIRLREETDIALLDIRSGA
jgi:Tol biopolymer transport system component